MPRYIDADAYEFPGDLLHVPTADVVEVKHGRWKGAGMGDYYCSLCLGTVSGNEYKFCPYCGAKMKEGE